MFAVVPGASTAADVGILSTSLVACELWAEQVYQYNDTCHPDTWTRDDPLNRDVIAAVHANDQHWKDFPTDGQVCL